MGLLESILELRAYRDAYARNEAADTAEAQKALRYDTWVQRVKETELALVAEELEREKASAECPTA